jgi:hypothetical protein
MFSNRSPSFLTKQEGDFVLSNQSRIIGFSFKKSQKQLAMYNGYVIK